MASYNRFGATYDKVVEYFSGAVVADFGGQTAVETIMDFIEVDMVAIMNPAIRRALKRVDGMIVVEAATASQVVIDVPTSGGLEHGHTSNWEVWVNYHLTGDAPLQPEPGTGYTNGDGMTISAESDAIRITLTAANALTANDVVIMSCDIDPTDTDYEVETLKQVMLVGTAGMIGPKAYSDQDDNPTSTYKSAYNDWKKRLADSRKGLLAVPEFSARNQVTSWNIGTLGLTGKIRR